MRIGIDARYYGEKSTGIGRYVQYLVKNLVKIDRKNQYFLFGDQSILADIEGHSNFQFIKLKTKNYTILEQLINPIVFLRYKLDLLHVPHFNAPIFYPKKYIVTIHDLIKHLSVGRATTTLPMYQYLIKLLAYKFIVRANLLRSTHIIVPSNYWKDYLHKNYKIPDPKITVTYESTTDALKTKTITKGTEILNKYGLSKPFLIYTGNLYPHKNVSLLIEAVNDFNQIHEHQLTLAIACARNDVFKSRLSIDNEQIKFLGYVPDLELIELYHQGLALVQPSLIEGFGLTGLEAMSAGLPVISSNATCLPEIYQDAAIYFNPLDKTELVEKINLILTDHQLASEMRERGLKQVKKYSWKKMAKQTLAVYQSI